MKKRKLIYVPILLLPIVLFLAACGREERQRGIDGYLYEAELLPDTEGWGDNIKSSGSWLYYMKNQHYLYRIPFNDSRPDGGQAGEVFCREQIQDYTVGADGSVYCYQPEIRGRDGMIELTDGTLARYGEDGSELYSYSLEGRSAVYESIYSPPGFLAVGDGGKAFLRLGDEILVVDSGGKPADEIDISKLRPEDDYSGTEKLLEGGEDRVYYLSATGSRLAVYELLEEGGLYRANAMSMKGLEGKDLSGGSFYGSPQGFLYGGEDGLLYRYSPEEGSWQELLRWGDSNLWQDAREIVWIGDRLLAMYYAHGGNAVYNEFYLLDRKSVADIPEKEELVLACVDRYSNELEDAVIRFNRDSDSCHITIRLYEGEEGLARLDAGLTSSSAPDLLDLSFLDIAKYSAKQALEDLSGYLDDSDVLGRESFLEEILEGYSVGGRLVGIPSGFVCFTVVGHAAEVGSRAGWTLQDIMALTERYPGRKLNGRSFAVNLENLCGDYIMERFVYRENGECDFNSEEFRGLIQWVAGHSGHLDGYYGVTAVEDPLLGEAYVMHLPDYLSYVSRPEDGTTSMGYPSADGTPLYRSSTSNALGIPSKSRHKEEAWQFIERFLTTEMDRTWQSAISFPSRRDLLDRMLEEAMVPEYWTGDGKALTDAEGNPEEKWKWAGSYRDMGGELVE